MLVSEIYEVEDCIKAYSLATGTTYKTVTGGSGTIIISDGIWNGGCGFLLDSWDNTVNWKLECDVMFKHGGTGIGLCATSMTSRTSQRMFKMNQSGACVYTNNSYNDNNIGTLPSSPLNVWTPLIITRNNGTISFTYNGSTIGSSGWSYRNDSVMSLGTDQWSNGDGVSFKNLRIKPL